jgi:hypothetical protein
VNPHPIDPTPPRAKPLSKSKNRASHKWPCDGVARFSVKGREGLLCYADTYDAIVLDEGGEIKPDGGVVFTKKGFRRVEALNQRYLWRPEVKAFQQSEYIRRVMAAQKANEDAAAKLKEEENAKEAGSP